MMHVHWLKYHDDATGTVWSIQWDKDRHKTLLWCISPEGEGEKVELEEEYIQCLDIFFKSYDIEFWQEEAPKDRDTKGTEFDPAEEMDSEAGVTDSAYLYCSISFYDGTRTYSRTFEEAEEGGEGEGLFKECEQFLQCLYQEAPKPLVLTYPSFDGGGPSYTMTIHQPGIFTWFCRKVYHSPDHDQVCGAGFDYVYKLYPVRCGTASAVIRGASPICPEEKVSLKVCVDENLTLTCETE